MKEIIQKVKQYRNLILVVAVAIVLIALVAADPLGFCAQRAHDRAAIHNQMAIEKAEAEKQIAIIRAQTGAELKRIELGVTENTITQEQTSDSETDTLAED